jgi:hypothetical protein
MMRVFLRAVLQHCCQQLGGDLAELAEVVIIEAKYAFVWTFMKRHESLLEVKPDGRDREKAFR